MIGITRAKRVSETWNANIGTICRKQARRLAEGKTDKLVGDDGNRPGISRRLQDPERRRRLRSARSALASRSDWPGLRSGGDVLFVEANKMKGKGSFTMTGQIGR